MAASLYRHGQEALSFIDHLKKINSREALLTEFTTFLDGFGYSSWLITGIPPEGHDLSSRVILNGWKPEWYRLYLQESFIDIDPCAKHSARSVNAFRWSEAPFQTGREKLQQKIMDLAASFGMRQGICVPIHSLDGFQAAVTVAGSQPDSSFKALSCLGLVAMFVHSRAVSFGAVKKKNKPLSVREREVLSWTSLGLNAQEIGDKIGISTDCVEMYIKRASLKLNTRGRIRTVIEAYKNGEINIC